MSTGRRSFDARLELIPQEPGVYLMKDASGSVIYVGKAINLPNRLRNYFSPGPGLEPKIKAMISHIADFSYVLCKNELEALILENNLIKQYRPKYNTLLRDDKEYPYIRVTLNEPYPRVLKAYRVGPDRDQGARYYGPYLAGDLQRALRAIYRIFPVMTCTRVLPRDIDKARPCLKYYIGRCIGPCKSDISRADYLESIEEICHFLDGQYDDLLAKIKAAMDRAAERLDFEEAAMWRDRYQDLLGLTENQIIVTKNPENIDALGLDRNASEVCVQKLEIRNGRMIGSVSSFMQDQDQTAADLLSSFLKQHYAASSYIPALILLPESLAEADLIADYLSQLAGHKVELRWPQRGEKKQILAMAQKNAKQNLSRHTLIGGSATGLSHTLMKLADIFHLEEPPRRIEAYDMANLASSDRTGAMVVFTEGKPLRSAYRHFHIKSFEGIDDYRSMAEVISRRLGRLEDSKFGSRPDLILLDGGLGHVRTIQPILESFGLDIPLAGIVKDRRHRTHGLVLSDGSFIELKKDREDDQESADQRSERLGLLRLMTAIQNEAHYFAGRLQKKAGFKRTVRYSLEEIAGVGPSRRRLLLKQFKTVKGVEEASLEELRQVPGLPEEVAQAVYTHFRPKEVTGGHSGEAANKGRQVQETET